VSEAAAAVVVNTQPKAAPAEASVADANAAPAQAAEAKEAPAAETPAAEAALETEKPAGEKWARLAKREAKLRAREREVAQLEQQAREAIAWRDGLKTKKGMALLKELDLDPEEHLSDVVVNGKPDPVRDVAERAAKAEAKVDALTKQLEERDQETTKRQQMAQLQAGISACAEFISAKGNEYPHAAKLLEGVELQRAIFAVHRQAEDEGLSLTFPQVAKVVETRAKAAYEVHEQRRQKLAAGSAAPAKDGEQRSEAGPRETRPVNTLTNDHASQSASVGRPSKSRAERKRELIAELEARAAAKR